MLKNETLLSEVDESTRKKNLTSCILFSAKGSRRERSAPGGSAATLINVVPKGMLILALLFTAHVITWIIGLSAISPGCRF